MTTEQERAFDQGYEDRCKGHSMRETFTMAREVQNAYRNGYVEACEGFSMDRAATRAEQNFGC